MSDINDKSKDYQAGYLAALEKVLANAKKVLKLAENQENYIAGLLIQQIINPIEWDIEDKKESE